MFTTDDVRSMKRICKHVSSIVVEILKEVLPTSNNIPCQFVDMNASFFSSSVNDLLWFTERFKLFIHYIGTDEFVINFSIDNCASNSTKLHLPKIDSYVFEHFFKPLCLCEL
jgi:hypothetical protein